MVVSVSESIDSSEKSQINSIFQPNKVSPDVSSQERGSDSAKLSRRNSWLYVGVGVLIIAVVICVALLGAGAASFKKKHARLTTCKNRLMQCQDDSRIVDREMDDISNEEENSDMDGDSGLWDHITQRLNDCIREDTMGNHRLSVLCLQENLFRDCWRDLMRLIARKIRHRRD